MRFSAPRPTLPVAGGIPHPPPPPPTSRLSEGERLAADAERLPFLLTEKQKWEREVGIVEKWFKGEAFEQFCDGEVRISTAVHASSLQAAHSSAHCCLCTISLGSICQFVVDVFHLPPPTHACVDRFRAPPSRFKEQGISPLQSRLLALLRSVSFGGVAKLTVGDLEGIGITLRLMPSPIPEDATLAVRKKLTAPHFGRVIAGAVVQVRPQQPVRATFHHALHILIVRLTKRRRIVVSCAFSSSDKSNSWLVSWLFIAYARHAERSKSTASCSLNFFLHVWTVSPSAQ
jgi:hypothetical protein